MARRELPLSFAFAAASGRSFGGYRVLLLFGGALGWCARLVRSATCALVSRQACDYGAQRRAAGRALSIDRYRTQVPFASRPPLSSLALSSLALVQALALRGSGRAVRRRGDSLERSALTTCAHDDGAQRRAAGRALYAWRHRTQVRALRRARRSALSCAGALEPRRRARRRYRSQATRMRSIAEVPLSRALLLRRALATTGLSDVWPGRFSPLGATACRCVAEVPCP